MRNLDIVFCILIAWLMFITVINNNQTHINNLAIQKMIGNFDKLMCYGDECYEEVGNERD